MKYYGGLPEKTLLDCDVQLNHTVMIIPVTFICLNIWYIQRLRRKTGSEALTLLKSWAADFTRSRKVQKEMHTAGS